MRLYMNNQLKQTEVELSTQRPGDTAGDPNYTTYPDPVSTGSPVFSSAAFREHWAKCYMHVRAHSVSNFEDSNI